jgi:hypothetical protein
VSKSKNVMKKPFGYLAILFSSFFITLWFLDRYDNRPSPWVGTKVTYEITAEKQPEVCASAKSTIQFTGQICSVVGDNLSVLWMSLANTTNAQPSCGPAKVVRWYRKENDSAYNARYLGSCGIKPEYFLFMPSTFGPNVLRAPTG